MYCERYETRQTKVSEQNTSNRKLVFLRNGSSGLIRQKWRAGTSKRRIGLRENTLRFEVIDKPMLGVVEVKFELLTKKHGSESVSWSFSLPILTWSTAGMTLAVGRISSSFFCEKLETPMAFALPISRTNSY